MSEKDYNNMETPSIPRENTQSQCEKYETKQNFNTEIEIPASVENHSRDEKLRSELLKNEKISVIAASVNSVQDEKIKYSSIIILGVLWMITLTVNNFILKRVFSNTRNNPDSWSPVFFYSLLVKVIQPASIALYSWLFLAFKKCEKIKPEFSEIYYLRYIVPVAFSMIVRSRIKDHLIWTTPMSETFTIYVEAYTPFFMIVFSKVILEYTHISNVKIGIFGLAGASFVAFWTRPSMGPHVFLWTETIGFATLISLEMIFSKKILQEKRIHPMRLLIHYGCLMLCVALPIFIFEFGERLRWNLDYITESFNVKTFVIFLIQGITCWMQTAVAFKILSIESPIRYAVKSIIVHVLSAIVLILVFRFVYMRNYDTYFDLRYIF